MGLGELLAGDLVAELPHRAGGRTDEDNARFGERIGEGRTLAEKTPTRPHGVAASLLKEPHDAWDVEVRGPPLAVITGDQRLPQRNGGVRLLHEERIAIGLCVEGDDFERLATTRGPRSRSVRSRRSMPSIEPSRSRHRGGTAGIGTAGRRRHSSTARAAISAADSR